MDRAKAVNGERAAGFEKMRELSLSITGATKQLAATEAASVSARRANGGSLGFGVRLKHKQAREPRWRGGMPPPRGARLVGCLSLGPRQVHSRPPELISVATRPREPQRVCVPLALTRFFNTLHGEREHTTPSFFNPVQHVFITTKTFKDVRECNGR